MTNIKKSTTNHTIVSCVMRSLPILFCLSVFVLLLSLSVWQFHRADEKKIRQSELALLQSRPMLTEKALIERLPQALNLRKISLTGTFINKHVFLLDNQIHNGKVGYHVLVPFKIQGTPSQVVLINRGWIAASPDRQVLPEIPPVPHTVQLKGTLRIPSINPMIHDLTEPGATTWPLRIQKIDIGALENYLEHTLSPLVLYLSADSAYTLTPILLPEQWLTPERHLGYALQWLLLAIAWGVIANLFLFKKTKPSDT